MYRFARFVCCGVGGHSDSIYRANRTWPHTRSPREEKKNSNSIERRSHTQRKAICPSSERQTDERKMINKGKKRLTPNVPKLIRFACNSSHYPPWNSHFFRSTVNIHANFFSLIVRNRETAQSSQFYFVSLALCYSFRSIYFPSTRPVSDQMRRACIATKRKNESSFFTADAVETRSLREHNDPNIRLIQISIYSRLPDECALRV